MKFFHLITLMTEIIDENNCDFIHKNKQKIANLLGLYCGGYFGGY